MRMLTSTRITIVFHQLEQRRTVIEINTRLQAASPECGDLDRGGSPAEGFAKRVFDDRVECSSTRRGDFLRFGKQVRIKLYGCLHAGQNIRVGG